MLNYVHQYFKIRIVFPVCFKFIISETKFGETQIFFCISDTSKPMIRLPPKIEKNLLAGKFLHLNVHKHDGLGFGEFKTVKCKPEMQLRVS